MELEIIEQALRKAINSHRQLLPLLSRDLELEELNTQNTVVFSRDKGTFNMFCGHWEDFLNGIDRFWNLVNSYRKHFATPDNARSVTDFLATINSQRTTDELLKYLDKARNNAHHTLWRHLIESRPYEVITGHGATIEFSSNSVTVSGPGDSANEVNILMRPGIILLKDIIVYEKKKEVTYGLPTSHLNYQLKPMERVLPQIIGQKGIQYYQKVLSEFIRLA